MIANKEEGTDFPYHYIRFLYRVLFSLRRIILEQGYSFHRELYFIKLDAFCRRLSIHSCIQGKRNPFWFCFFFTSEEIHYAFDLG